MKKSRNSASFSPFRSQLASSLFQEFYSIPTRDWSAIFEVAFRFMVCILRGSFFPGNSWKSQFLDGSSPGFGGSRSGFVSVR